MSDLCYNCLLCHLPDSCPKELTHCDTCYQWGHNKIFCPHGVKDPNHRYVALCHNCDRWHLPHPCPEPLHRCGQCQLYGHTAYYCPVQPLEREEYLEERRKKFPDGPTLEQSLFLMTHRELGRIKVESAKRVIGMVKHGFSDEDIFETVSHPQTLEADLPFQPRPPVRQPRQPGSHPVRMPLQPQPVEGQVQPMAGSFPVNPERGDTPGTYARMQQRFDQGSLAKSAEQNQQAQQRNQQAHQNQQAQQNQQALEWQAREQQQHQQVRKSVETQNHEKQAQNGGEMRFLQTQNTLAASTPLVSVASRSQPKKQNITPKMPNAMLNFPNATPMTQQVAGDAPPAKKAKKSKSGREGTPIEPGSVVKQGPRCAKCIKTHKRCTHRGVISEQTPNPEPNPDQLSGMNPLFSSIPVSSTPSVVPEGYVLAQPTMPDNSITPPPEHKISTANASPKDTATAGKRKRED